MQYNIKKFVVVGGSQSAIEIILDLHFKYPDAQIYNIQRGYGFRLKDTSQFSEHIYFPSFINYYFGCDNEGKKRINKHLHYTNYSAADADVIKELYLKLYEDKMLSNKQRVYIHGFCEVNCVKEENNELSISVTEMNTGEQSVINSIDCIILATGFKDLGSDENSEKYPSILKSLYPYLQTNENGVITISRDYKLNGKNSGMIGPLYLNGLCESSHGYGDAGSFSLLAIRSQEILQSLKIELNNCTMNSLHETNILNHSKGNVL